MHTANIPLSHSRSGVLLLLPAQGHSQALLQGPPAISSFKLFLSKFLQFWGSEHEKDLDQLGYIQRRATKEITGLEHLCYGHRLRELVVGEEKAPGTHGSTFQGLK